MLGYPFIIYGQYTLNCWLVIALVVAAVTDVFQRRIPNLMSYSTILLSFLTYLLIGGLDGLLFSLSGFIFGSLAFFLPYIMGGMGAGDVKLMSAVGAVLGFKMTVVSSLVIAICGGVLALCFIVYRRHFRSISLAFLSYGIHRDLALLKADSEILHNEKIPYGVAIASGVFLLLLYLIIHDRLPIFQAS